MEMIMYRQYFTVHFASKEWDFQKVFPSFLCFIFVKSLNADL